MKKPEHPRQLRADATFREVADAFPAAKPALEKCPTAKVGKRWSLQQVAAAGGTENILDYAATSAKAPLEPAIVTRPSRAMGNAVLLVLLGLLAVTGWEAALHGEFMLIPNPPDEVAGYGATIPYWWFNMQTVQLWGWVMMAGLGLAVTVLRGGMTGNARSGLGTGARILLLLGVVAMLACRFFGGPSMPLERSAPALIGASCMLLAGVMMTLDLLLLLRGRQMDAAFLFLLLAAQWMLVWLAAAVSLQWRFREDAMGEGETVRLMTLLPVLGFGVHLMMAAATRILPGALGLRPPRQRALLLGLAIFNAGTASLLLWPDLLARLGPAAGVAFALRTTVFSIGVPVGAVLFLAGLGFLRRGRTVSGLFLGSGAGAVMIRLAFFWLMAGALLLAGDFFWRYAPDGRPPPSFVAAYRHILTAGFLGTMIFGLAARMAGLFVPAALRASGAGAIACALWTGGVVVHVMASASVLLGNSQVLWVLALSSAMELAAAAMLGLLLMRAVRTARRTGSGELTAATRLDAVINARPQVELTLEAAGINLLEGATRVPPVPLGAVACAWGWGMAEWVETVAEAMK